MPIANILRKNGLKIALPVLLASNVVVADWTDEMDIYVGAGIGQSYLTPPTNGAGYSLDDTSGDSWKLVGGVDLTDHISIEGFYANLGRATVSPEGDVSFKMQGGDVIFHYWAKGEERAEGSVALYAKTGISWINTDQNFKRDHTTNIKVGLGAEMYLPHNFSVRLEAESYYADADLFSVNLVKRFGLRSATSSAQEAANKLSKQSMEDADQKMKLAKAEAEKAAQLKADEAAKKLAEATPVVIDADSDGVQDDMDKCLGTAKDDTVDEAGCTVYAGVVGDKISSEELEFDATDIKFNVNSASPTESSLDSLDKVAVLLFEYTSMKVEVQAHSDSSGAASYNKMLSQKRADAVVAYLVDQGIDASRLTSVGYGEETPVADNSTKAGRSQNRRVEFVLLGK